MQVLGSLILLKKKIIIYFFWYFFIICFKPNVWFFYIYFYIMENLSKILSMVNSESNLYKFFIEDYNYDRNQMNIFLELTNYSKVEDSSKYFGQKTACFFYFESMVFDVEKMIDFLEFSLETKFVLEKFKHALYDMIKIKFEPENIELVLIKTKNDIVIFLRPLNFYLICDIYDYLFLQSILINFIDSLCLDKKYHVLRKDIENNLFINVEDEKVIYEKNELLGSLGLNNSSIFDNICLKYLII